MVRKKSLARALVVLFALCGPAQGQGVVTAQTNGQAALELITTMPFQGVFSQLSASATPHAPFSSWTTDQQHAIPTNLTQVCAMFWTFFHDRPGTKFLPESVSNRDEGELGVDLCLVGHMPIDWPGRAARLQSATEILRRADQAGSTLHLPSEIEN